MHGIGVAELVPFPGFQIGFPNLLRRFHQLRHIGRSFAHIIQCGVGVFGLGHGTSHQFGVHMYRANPVRVVYIPLGGGEQTADHPIDEVL